MRRLLMIAGLLVAPLVAVAQAYSNAPMVVIEDGASNQPITPVVKKSAVPGAEFPNFPANAITRVGENTMGQHEDTPATPPSPAAPANPQAAATPTTPASPTAPASPTNPVSKLWPRDTIELFLPPCTRLRPQFVVPCTCVITKLMVAMPHDEFLKKSEDGTIEEDERLKKIRSECATSPQRKE